MAEIVTEDTFTQPSAWCPSPGHWHCEDNGGATEVEVIELVVAFVRALQPEVVVETGSFTGMASESIGNALVRNGHGMLHTVELDPVYADQTRQRCAGLPVTVLTGNSLDWQPPDGIGFAWVDGGWDRDQEFAHLLSYFLPGAIIGVHDTAPHQTWNPLSVSRFTGSVQLRPITLRTPRGVTFAEVCV